ncbi:MAG: hypothetical protein BIFFINMI_02641 [Phycisphaerae bacterium]|nr:hypothetical protein [Phycisphaerae bacterium]
MADETPKIHIDSDWKKQAHEEKERLAKEVEEKSAAGGGPEAVGPEGLPEPTFAEIVATLATQAFMFMGEGVDPQSGQRMVSLPVAKHFIDLLSVLDAKTQGNLGEDEKKNLDRWLYEARMRYVQLAGGAMGTPRRRPPGGPAKGK